jgi:protein-L-isoaspartate(D-aspartate) O-methyltransferase
MIDFEAARRHMIDSQIRTNNVTDPRVLRAIGTVAREKFVPAARSAIAYVDEDVPIGAFGDPARPRYLMEPMPFARLVQLADVASSDLVLDVGCATGYASAVLAQLADSVVALEADEGLAATATRNLAEQAIDNVAVVTGPLEAGYPSEGPYDVIFLGGAVAEAPTGLFDQLAEGGRLVAVVGEGLVGKAAVFTKHNGITSERSVFDAAVPILPGFEQRPTFVF